MDGSEKAHDDRTSRNPMRDSIQTFLESEIGQAESGEFLEDRITAKGCLARGFAREEV